MGAPVGCRQVRKFAFGDNCLGLSSRGARSSPPKRSGASSLEHRARRRLGLHASSPSRPPTLGRPIQRRIVEALDRLVGDPPARDVVKLAGSDDEWRLRVGDWRVRFTRDDERLIHVLRVLPRGRAYRD
jgi:mRNA interferase RelE/StbE